ncbi:hypothetical protein DFH27DRAFT_46001 [Peziza echinospora]|nr:hypothetical protein DFH27DRAFT_46001 [Peziza echinospora]
MASQAVPAPVPVKKAEKAAAGRVEKPDEAAFKAKLAVLEKELAEARANSTAIKDKLALAEPSRSRNGAPAAQNPAQQKQTKLRDELTAIRTEQSTFKSSKQKIFDQITVLDNSVKAKLAEQKAARSKIPFKSVAELDAGIARLEAQIESGTMKLVDERKALADQSNLRKQRKTLVALDEAQAAITQEKAKIAELRSQVVESPEQKKLSDRFTEITKELDALKAEQDAVYKNLSALRDERTRLRKIEDEKYSAKKQLEDQYYTAKKAFIAFDKAAREARNERYRAERDQKDKEYKLKLAKEKMDEASSPAYYSEILTCESLIAHFDPTSPEALSSKTKGSLLKDAGLKATASRLVSDEPKGTRLTKKDDREEEYFSGKAKKGKKGSNKNSGAATPTAPATADDKGKFQLNSGILVELGRIDVRAPIGWDGVPECIEKLREKLAWYKENSERVTKENIAKAQKEIDAIYGKSTTSSETAPEAAVDAIATPEAEKEEEEELPLPVPATTASEEVKETEQ